MSAQRKGKILKSKVSLSDSRTLPSSNTSYRDELEASFFPSMAELRKKAYHDKSRNSSISLSMSGSSTPSEEQNLSLSQNLRSVDNKSIFKKPAIKCKKNLDLSSRGLEVSFDSSAGIQKQICSELKKIPKKSIDINNQSLENSENNSKSDISSIGKKMFINKVPARLDLTINSDFERSLNESVDSKPTNQMLKQKSLAKRFSLHFNNDSLENTPIASENDVNNTAKEDLDKSEKSCDEIMKESTEKCVANENNCEEAELQNEASDLNLIDTESDLINRSALAINLETRNTEKKSLEMPSGETDFPQVDIDNKFTTFNERNLRSNNSELQFDDNKKNLGIPEFESSINIFNIGEKASNVSNFDTKVTLSEICIIENKNKPIESTVLTVEKSTSDNIAMNGTDMSKTKKTQFKTCNEEMYKIPSDMDFNERDKSISTSEVIVSSNVSSNKDVEMSLSGKSQLETDKGDNIDLTNDKISEYQDRDDSQDKIGNPFGETFVVSQPCTPNLPVCNTINSTFVTYHPKQLKPSNVTANQFLMDNNTFSEEEPKGNNSLNSNNQNEISDLVQSENNKYEVLPDGEKDTNNQTKKNLNIENSQEVQVNEETSSNERFKGNAASRIESVIDNVNYPENSQENCPAIDTTKNKATCEILVDKTLESDETQEDYSYFDIVANQKDKSCTVLVKPRISNILTGLHDSVFTNMEKSLDVSKNVLTQQIRKSIKQKRRSIKLSNVSLQANDKMHVSTRKSVVFSQPNSEISNNSEMLSQNDKTSQPPLPLEYESNYSTMSDLNDSYFKGLDKSMDSSECKDQLIKDLRKAVNKKRISLNLNNKTLQTSKDEYFDFSKNMAPVSETFHSEESSSSKSNLKKKTSNCCKQGLVTENTNKDEAVNVIYIENKSFKDKSYKKGLSGNSFDKTAKSVHGEVISMAQEQTKHNISKQKKKINSLRSSSNTSELTSKSETMEDDLKLELNNEVITRSGLGLRINDNTPLSKIITEDLAKNSINTDTSINPDNHVSSTNASDTNDIVTTDAKESAMVATKNLHKKNVCDTNQAVSTDAEESDLVATKNSHKKNACDTNQIVSTDAKENDMVATKDSNKKKVCDTNQIVSTDAQESDLVATKSSHKKNVCDTNEIVSTDGEESDLVATMDSNKTNTCNTNQAVSTDAKENDMVATMDSNKKNICDTNQIVSTDAKESDLVATKSSHKKNVCDTNEIVSTDAQESDLVSTDADEFIVNSNDQNTEESDDHHITPINTVQIVVKESDLISTNVSNKTTGSDTNQIAAEDYVDVARSGTNNVQTPLIDDVLQNRLVNTLENPRLDKNDLKRIQDEGKKNGCLDQSIIEDNNVFTRSSFDKDLNNVKMHEKSENHKDKDKSDDNNKTTSNPDNRVCTRSRIKNVENHNVSNPMVEYLIEKKDKFNNVLNQSNLDCISAKGMAGSNNVQIDKITTNYANEIIARNVQNVKNYDNLDTNFTTETGAQVVTKDADHIVTVANDSLKVNEPKSISLSVEESPVVTRDNVGEDKNKSIGVLKRVQVLGKKEDCLNWSVSVIQPETEMHYNSKLRSWSTPLPLTKLKSINESKKGLPKSLEHEPKIIFTKKMDKKKPKKSVTFNLSSFNESVEGVFSPNDSYTDISAIAGEGMKRVGKSKPVCSSPYPIPPKKSIINQSGESVSERRTQKKNISIQVTREYISSSSSGRLSQSQVGSLDRSSNRNKITSENVSSKRTSPVLSDKGDTPHISRKSRSENSQKRDSVQVSHKSNSQNNSGNRDLAHISNKVDSLNNMEAVNVVHKSKNSTHKEDTVNETHLDSSTDEFQPKKRQKIEKSSIYTDIHSEVISARSISRGKEEEILTKNISTSKVSMRRQDRALTSITNTARQSRSLDSSLVEKSVVFPPKKKARLEEISVVKSAKRSSRSRRKSVSRRSSSEIALMNDSLPLGYSVSDEEQTDMESFFNKNSWLKPLLVSKKMETSVSTASSLNISSQELMPPPKTRKVKNKPLAKPAPWANAKFYKFLFDFFKPRYGIEYRKRSEDFVIFLHPYVESVVLLKNKKDYAPLVLAVKEKTKELGLCTSIWDYSSLCHHLPTEFKNKSYYCGSKLFEPVIDHLAPF